MGIRWQWIITSPLLGLAIQALTPSASERSPKPMSTLSCRAGDEAAYVSGAAFTNDGGFGI